MANERRGEMGRPTGQTQPTDPQTLKEARITAIFKDQYKALAALFPKDGATMVNRARAAAVIASRSPALRGATAESVAEKVIAAHHMGVEIGEAYLVPYNGDVQLILGPRALIALMYRSGFVKSVEARAVFEGDEFDYELGDSPRIRHKKAMANRRDAAIVAGYVVAHTTTGGIVREVLTREDIDYYRSFSKAKSGPWFDNFEGMVRKTLIHRIAEFIPRSPILSAALTQNEAGGVVVTDEIMAILKGKPDGAEDGAPVAETVTVPAASREPGAEG